MRTTSIVVVLGAVGFMLPALPDVHPWLTMVGAIIVHLRRAALVVVTKKT